MRTVNTPCVSVLFTSDVDGSDGPFRLATVEVWRMLGAWVEELSPHATDYPALRTFAAGHRVARSLDLARELDGLQIAGVAASLSGDAGQPKLPPEEVREVLADLDELLGPGDRSEVVTVIRED